ncbi:MAG: hypothetical protein RR902_04475, partial [Oscillospiraceae bacterium]
VPVIMPIRTLQAVCSSCDFSCFVISVLPLIYSEICYHYMIPFFFEIFNASNSPFLTFVKGQNGVI